MKKISSFIYKIFFSVDATSAEKPLTKVIPFWAWNFLFIITSSILFIKIGMNGNYNFSISSNGCNVFMRDFKMPISILAFIIPSSALISTIHRSIQSKRRIQQADEQLDIQIKSTNFINYYKHREEFTKYFESRKDLPTSQIDSLYKDLYPDSRNGIYNISDSYIANIEKLLYDMFEQIINKPEINSSYKAIIAIIAKTYIDLPISTYKYHYTVDSFIDESTNEIDRSIENGKKSGSLQIPNIESCFWRIPYNCNIIKDILDLENRRINKNSMIQFIESNTVQDLFSIEIIENCLPIRKEAIASVENHLEKYKKEKILYKLLQ
jgi:hypothetical protein